MELLLVENNTGKEVKLFSNASERIIDLITTQYDSTDDFLESIGLDSKKFSVIKRYKDKNTSIPFDFLTNEYNGILDLVNSKEMQEDFIDTICNSSPELIQIHVSDEYINRSIYRNNKYLWDAKKPIEDVFAQFDFLIELLGRDLNNEKILDSQKEKCRETIKNYLYDKDGKIIYTNFSGFYKFLCDKKIIDNSLSDEDISKKDVLSTIFKDKLKNRIENGTVKSVPRDSLLKIDSLREKLNEIRNKKYDDQPLYSSIRESYDIDSFETNLDIMMDELGYDDEEKIKSRIEMRKQFEKRNKAL